MKAKLFCLVMLVASMEAHAQSTSSRLFLDSSGHNPKGLIFSFTSQTDVENRYGVNSQEGKYAQEFYKGTVSPPYYTMLFTRMPSLPARAHLFGSDINQESRLQSINAITNGEISLSVNGYPYQSSPLDFSKDASFDEIRKTLQNDLNSARTVQAVANVSIAPQSATFTASLNGAVLAVTSVQQGTIEVGGYVCRQSNPCYGPDLPSEKESNDYIGLVTAFIGWEPGVNGGTGYYTLFLRGPTVTQTSLVETYGLMTVNSVIRGKIAPNLDVRGPGVDQYTAIERSYSRNVWVVDQSQTVSAQKVRLLEPPLIVEWWPMIGATVNTGFLLIQTSNNFNWKGTTISFATDVQGYQPVAALLGLTQGSTGVNGVPNTNSYTDPTAGMISTPATWMNAFAKKNGYPASTFQLMYRPDSDAPPGLMTDLQQWGMSTPMSYLMSCSETTNSIVLGGSCH